MHREDKADDYITKPFSKQVLIARIKAALRRPALRQELVCTLGSLRLDKTARGLLAAIGIGALVVLSSSSSCVGTRVCV